MSDLSDCECRELLLARHAQFGWETTVTSLSPADMAAPYEPKTFRCPHGTKWRSELIRGRLMDVEAANQ